MFRSILLGIHVLLLLAGLESASAHTGFENETDVRIHSDRMEVNVRTTFGFAWKILGDRAPADTGDAGRQIAEPLLKEQARGLFEVAAGGREMVLKSVDCIFELDEHVFFRLVYERPNAWPLVLKARFFDHFDPLTHGTVRVFDQTHAPHSHDIEPEAEQKIYQSKPAFTYDPTPPEEATETEEVSPIPAPLPEPPKSREFRGYYLWPLVLLLIWIVWRALSKHSNA